MELFHKKVKVKFHKVKVKFHIWKFDLTLDDGSLGLRGDEGHDKL